MSFEQTSYPDYSAFIHLSRYSRWREKDNRRESWRETVERWKSFWEGELGDKMPDGYLSILAEAIYNLEVMPSMRSLMTAGEALRRDSMAGYNCSAVAVTGRGKKLDILTPEMEELGFDEPISIQLKNPITFDEIFYILLCGTGVGFSEERQYIANLPTVGKQLDRNIYRRTNNNYPGVPKDELSYIARKSNTIQVADSKYGWASALRILIVEGYNGNFDVKWDMSQVRPAGEKLKIFGGRSSGPGPLDELFHFAVDLFRAVDGRKLTSLEAHSLVCKIAAITVVGGVRRSALLALSNLSDDRMRYAKSGNWYLSNGHFALSNNSACYTEKPTAEIFLREWTALVESKSGERGIFNREASRKQAARNGRRDASYDFLTNPCSEIILRDQQVCNLSEVVARSTDTYEDLERKVSLATVLGTMQATLTDFKYVNPEWKKNTEEERLLGVSITGIMDHPVLSGAHDREDLPGWLGGLKQIAIDTNAEWADIFGIARATAITAVKPSGTVSQLVDSASGIHTRNSDYVLRSVRNDIKDPMTLFMDDMGVYNEEDITSPSNKVFYFPLKSPMGSITKDQITALEQLEIWRIYQKYWCEHKPSCTISVGEDEWMEVGAWVYKHFDDISGISFLPRDDHSYQQAPYQELTEEEYYKWIDRMPKDIDWSKLSEYEKDDQTKGITEYACAGGSCEIL